MTAVLDLPITFRVISLTRGQAYGYHVDNEAALQKMDQLTIWATNNRPYNHNATIHNTIACEVKYNSWHWNPFMRTLGRCKFKLYTCVKRRWGFLSFGCPFYFEQTYPPLRNYNPKNHCHMNSIIQLLFSILRTISQIFQFNSSTEGSISKFLFGIACSASSSTDVDVLKFRLVQYDKFYSGEQQEDASDCLMMLIELINKGSEPYCCSNDNNSTGVSPSEILFSFMLEKYIVCDVCGLRSPSFESSSVLYIIPTCTSSMQ